MLHWIYCDVLPLQLMTVCVSVYREGEDQKGMVNDERSGNFEVIYQYLGSKADA